MYFRPEDKFVKKESHSITFHVYYFDTTKGSTWEFRYECGKDDLKKAVKITCKGDKRWKTQSVTVSDAVMKQNGPKGSDFAIVNTDNKDAIFHLIEVERE